jgi:type VI protein secretion system component VasF
MTSDETRLRLSAQLPDPVRLLGWALCLMLAVSGYIWKGEVEAREKLQALQAADHEAISQLRTQVLVQGNSGQAMAQGFGELRDEMKRIRQLIEERNDGRRGRRNDP